ncbi:MAG: hypothetical protein PHD81_01940 [Candidatus Nanoarchaeia archaeon]|nr:hypothetical protein [Candidatus Nanoarchaeia archaeon]MDD5587850.1 hypothetical protein [Candidatus Nanoarchaeia archaeon]
MAYLLIFILIFLILTFLIFKLIKKIILAAISFVFMLAILLAIFGVFVYMDFLNLQENLPIQDNILLLKDNNAYLTGISYNMKNANTEQLPNIITDINSYNSKSYSEILGSNYKLIIMDISFIEENLDPNFSLTEKTITINKQEIISLLKSNNPIKEFLAQKGMPEQAIQFLPADYSSTEKLKAILFLAANKDIVEKQSISPIIKGFKKGQIIVYKQTVLFEFVKYLPTPLVESILNSQK